MDELRKIVSLALSRPPEQRLPYITIACGDNHNMQAEAIKWLEAVAESQELQPAVELQTNDSHWMQTSSLSGHRVGPYILEDLIGWGGMGLVYRARREEGEFRQTVAIKLVLPNAPRKLLQRFLSERNILASLNHPYVARLYDGGSHNGQPYFVMEYIDGDPIDVYCRRHNLSVKQRVRLFIKVLEAVQYAHQRLLIHRDLKPANIIVTPNGVPKLLDFGIAKLIEDDEQPDSFHTRTGDRAMSRDYASPEQIREQPVATTSDIYSLGVLFYKLLTGVLPYRLERITASQLEHAICNQESEPPSRAIARIARQSHAFEHDKLLTDRSPENHERYLKGDLDHIILKSIRKDMSQRYNTVGEFMADLSNHLSGLPVLARKGEKWYRAKKWCIRNSLYIGFAAIIFLGIITFAIVTTIQAARIADERDNATKERDKFSAMVDLTKEMFSAADPRQARGDTITARQILDTGAQTVKDGLDDEPEIQSAFLKHIGEIYGQLGNYSRSKELLQEAIKIDVGRFGENHREVADGKFYLAVQHWNDGNYDESIRIYREVLSIYQVLDRPYDVAVTKGNIGLALMDIGDLEQAEVFLRQAIADFEVAFPEATADERYVDKFGLMNNLVKLLLIKNQLDDADAITEQILTQLGDYFPEDHPRWTAPYSMKANILNRLGRHTEAESYLQKALTVSKNALSEMHPETAAMQTALGLTMVRLQRYEEAKAYLTKAYQTLETFVRQGNLEPDHLYVQNVLMCFVRLYTALEQPQDAENYQRMLRRIQELSMTQK